jgi:hypothetical protein
MTEALDITRKLEILANLKLGDEMPSELGPITGNWMSGICAEALAEIYQLRGKLMSADAALMTSNVPNDWVRRSGYAMASLPIDNFRAHVQTPQTIEWSVAQDPTSFEPAAGVYTHAILDSMRVTSERIAAEALNKGAPVVNCIGDNWRDVVRAGTVECDTLPTDSEQRKVYDEGLKLLGLPVSESGGTADAQLPGLTATMIIMDDPHEPPTETPVEPWGSPFAMDTRNWK